MSNASHSVVIENLMRQIQAGDQRARDRLVDCACERLEHLARKMLRGFGRVKRWEETNDVLQNALLRLYRSLNDVQPGSAVEFYRLAATIIRRELLDLAKHYYGPHGLGANYASVDCGIASTSPAAAQTPPVLADDPGGLEAWARFHDGIERLPDEERSVFDLLWYQQMPRAEAAALLNVSERTVKRRWASARLLLHQALEGQSPES